MRVVSIALLACLMGSHAATLAVELEEGEIQVEAGLAAGRLTVPVTLNGVGPYPFMLDAALRLPVVDAQVAAFLDLAAAPAESGEAHRAILDRLEAGGLPAQTTSCVVRDLGELSAQLGAPIAGLLPVYQPGYEITLDYPGRTVTWRPAVESILFAQPGDTVPLRIVDQGAPRVNVLLNGTRLEECALDTLAGEFLTLPWTVLEEVGAHRDPAGALTLRGEGEHAVPATFTRLTEVRIGDIAAAQPLVRVTEGDDSFLGLRFLSRFRVTLNFEYGRAAFACDGPRQYSDPPLTGVGAVLDHLDGDHWVLRVLQPSPAATAGLLPGDHLLAIDGADAAGAPAHALEPLLAAPVGTERQLTIMRRGEVAYVRLGSVELL